MNYFQPVDISTRGMVKLVLPRFEGIREVIHAACESRRCGKPLNPEIFLKFGRALTGSKPFDV